MAKRRRTTGIEHCQKRLALLLLLCVAVTLDLVRWPTDAFRLHHHRAFCNPRRQQVQCKSPRPMSTSNNARSSRSLLSMRNESNDDDDIVEPPVAVNGEDVPLSRQVVEGLTLAQLKQQLRLRQLKVSGRKQELVNRLLDFSASRTTAPPIIQLEEPRRSSTSARQFAQDHGKELIDVTPYLDEDEQKRSLKSVSLNDGDEKDEEEQEADSSSSSSGPEVWGSEAKIVDDYEGRQIVVDNLSRTTIEYKGSNQTAVKAYLVASRDALQRFLEGATSNSTQTVEDRLREIQTKREMAARVPVREMKDDPGLDEGDETGLYQNIIERDFSDWGKFTQTGAQLSASEVQGVLLLSDVYGAFSDDTRALAEKIAFECQPVVVMVPDLFRETPWNENVSNPGFNENGQTYEEWRALHPDLRVSIDIRAAAACLRERYGVSSVAVWGTCYGGGRALEAAAGYFPNDNVHDVDGSVGPPPVDPMAAIAWYPTRYAATELFGKTHKGLHTDRNGNPRSVAVIAIFGGKDTIAGATPEDAADLKKLLSKDDRIKDHMVKVFPGQDHGFAHIGISARQERSGDDFERFVDDEFGGAGQVVMDGGDAEVACLLSTAWMETYSRVFLPTTGPAVSLDDTEAEWTSLEMKDLSAANSRDIRNEIEDALNTFVEEPLGGRRIDPTDESQKDELAKILKAMQAGDQPGPYTIKPDDDLTTIYAKLKASDENFQIF